MPRVVGELIDREKVNLPENLVPLARGVAIASDAFLVDLGRYGRRFPRDWLRVSDDLFQCLHTQKCCSSKGFRMYFGMYGASSADARSIRTSLTRYWCTVSDQRLSSPEAVVRRC
jgi:hypothetical protein